MSDRTAIGRQIEAALREAKPITRESALQIARNIMAKNDPSLIPDFVTWFEKHGDALVGKINA